MPFGREYIMDESHRVLLHWLQRAAAAEHVEVQAHLYGRTVVMMFISVGLRLMAVVAREYANRT
jgi:hypothetical protein